MKSLILKFKAKSWIVPIIVSIGLFVMIRPALAQLENPQQSLNDFLAEGNVEVGIEVVGGFSRVFYEYDGVRKYISQEGQNSKQVITNSKYVVWVSQENDQPGQIYLYDILSGSAIQITYLGTNSNPKVTEDGKVVWEGWVPDEEGGKWQVFFFDGTKVAQLTSGDISINPDIEGDNVVYARRDVSGTWRSVIYSVSKNEAKEIATGISSKHPKVKNGKILLADGSEEFPLTVEDLFVLDLAPLTVPSKVTAEDVAQELEATPSAQTETKINPTSTPVPEFPVATSEPDLSDQPVTPTLLPTSE